jgi:putative ABC transport system substrate-binding protein
LPRFCQRRFFAYNDDAPFAPLFFYWEKLMKNATAKNMLAAALVAALALPAAAAETARVMVSQIVEHPALDACRNGLLQGLKDAGYKEGDNLEFTFQTAQGQTAVAAQIAKQFVGENPDVLVGIATPTAQALANATKSIPIVFSAVTDPVEAKLLASMEAPGGNVTGISDLSPVAQHVETMKSIAPGLANIGLVYNPGEANAVALAELLKEAAAAANVKVVEGTATRTAEIGGATSAIAGQVDIFYAITDNTVASAIGAMVKAANAAGKPVFGAETSFVDAGAVAAVGFDYYQIGYQTADYVVKILRGAKPASLPARVAKGTDIVVNPAAAKALGVKLPAELTQNATRVVGEN